ncbi:arsenate reductase (glutaredoxin) [Aequorivita sp. H23M31]|uniref:Arsenate reductase (Glutaredoxin) n=1 Tax=Aequorivita ciconiae TaxID=2494375 RepID=A0A410G1A1_9FLAO|nr:arsenate reductase (glutaredoxin) [Aequorivita sp. H23M31]QAA81010.1 arsenate reductase (glutaredoxin) [Aequorivita sp. H23M31]
MTTLYHNPRCSSSREALRLLEESGETIEVVKYLQNPLSKKELEQLIELLGIKPIDLVRTKEDEWKENFKGKNLTDSQIIDAMVKFPKLMERPIAVNGTQAIIGRPAKNVLKIL